MEIFRYGDNKCEIEFLIGKYVFAKEDAMINDSIKIEDSDENMILLKEKLDEMSDLLDIISDNATMEALLEMTRNKTYLIQGQIIDAAIQTLLSIWGCCKHACFSDAFTLVRKFRDDLVQYLFIISTIDGIEDLSEEETGKDLIDLTNIDKILESLNLIVEIRSSGNRKKPHEKAVDSWLENTLSNEAHFNDRKLYFDASKYIEMFKKNDDNIKKCFDLYLKSLWSNLDRELNNYVHANGSKYIMSNLPYYVFEHEKDIIAQLISTIRDVMVVFISLIILIKSSYIHSSDYMDWLNVGEIPPEGSQYWISYGIQNFIDTDIVRVSSDLKNFLKENNKDGMEIE